MFSVTLAQATTTANVREHSLLSSISWRSVVVISLFISVWMSAFAVVYTTYTTRNHFSELQSLRQEHDNLFMEWTQLLLEQSAWTDTGHVEELADQELLMFFPSTEEINFLVAGQ